MKIIYIFYAILAFFALANIFEGIDFELDGLLSRKSYSKNITQTLIKRDEVDEIQLHLDTPWMPWIWPNVNTAMGAYADPLAFGLLNLLIIIGVWSIVFKWSSVLGVLIPLWGIMLIIAILRRRFMYKIGPKWLRYYIKDMRQLYPTIRFRLLFDGHRQR